MKPVHVRIEDWGRLDYETAHARQVERVDEVVRRPDQTVLCLVEHPPVFTLGRFGKRKNLVRPDPAVPLRKIERGGDITYHGPGQLVGYVMLHLDHHRLSIKDLVAVLERILSRAVNRFGVKARGREGSRGVWIRERKLASIGLALRRGVTWHGFALNVSTDLSAFERIHPCGLPGCPMTSLEREAGRRIGLEETKGAVRNEFRAYFERARSVAAEM